MKLTGTRCQCTVCEEYFSVVAHFDTHRVRAGERARCLSSEELLAKGLRKIDGIWTGAPRPDIKHAISGVAGSSKQTIYG